jgi:hypothetical protein
MFLLRQNLIVAGLVPQQDVDVAHSRELKSAAQRSTEQSSLESAAEQVNSQSTAAETFSFGCRGCHDSRLSGLGEIEFPTKHRSIPRTTKGYELANLKRWVALFNTGIVLRESNADWPRKAFSKAWNCLLLSFSIQSLTFATKASRLLGAK